MFRAVVTVTISVMMLLIVAAPISAQTFTFPEHLACYKVHDPTKLRGAVDIDVPEIAAAAGCRISGAAMFCTPGFTTVLSATSNGVPITQLPFSGAGPYGDRLCYKLRCPTAAIPTQLVTDPFGTRTLSNFTPSLLCTSVVQGAGFCGNGTIDPGELCDGTDLNGYTCQNLGYLSGTATCGQGCRYVDTSYCAGRYRLPATGQTLCWDSSGTVIPCAGTGQDGDLRAGASLDYAYIDDDDGTVSDRNTGLQWEKLSRDGSVHDVNNLYTWDDAFAHVATLNTTGFAGHNDWRLPNIRELESIVNYQPATFPPSAFDYGCISGCTVLTCNCTQTSYWSSTTSVYRTGYAFVLQVNEGDVSPGAKNSPNYVRAVRGG